LSLFSTHLVSISLITCSLFNPLVSPMFVCVFVLLLGCIWWLVLFVAGFCCYARLFVVPGFFLHHSILFVLVFFLNEIPCSHISALLRLTPFTSHPQPWHQRSLMRIYPIIPLLLIINPQILYAHSISMHVIYVGELWNNYCMQKPLFDLF
jgi:hypothetical protein